MTRKRFPMQWPLPPAPPFRTGLYVWRNGQSHTEAELVAPEAERRLLPEPRGPARVGDYIVVRAQP